MSEIKLPVKRESYSFNVMDCFGLLACSCANDRIRDEIITALNRLPDVERENAELRAVLEGIRDYPYANYGHALSIVHIAEQALSRLTTTPKRVTT